MDILVLGICANQTATNEAVSFIIDGKEKILIDTGPGIVRQILRSGHFCTEIAHVIVTHSHGDHTLGFPYFIWNHFYEGLEGKEGPECINVYSLASVIDGLKKMQDACYGSGKYPFNVEYYVVPDNKTGEFAIGNALLKTTVVEHTVPNFGIRLDLDNKSVSYSSDTIYNKAFINMAQNSDLLIHEGFVTEQYHDLSRKVKHATAKDAGLSAAESKSRELALVHIFPPFLEKKEELIEEAKSVYRGNVFIPEELSTIKIK